MRQSRNRRQIALVAAAAMLCGAPVRGQVADVPPRYAAAMHGESLRQGVAFQINQTRSAAEANRRYAVMQAAAEQPLGEQTTVPELLPAPKAEGESDQADSPSPKEPAAEGDPLVLQPWAADHRPLRSVGSRAMAAALGGYVAAAKGYNEVKWRTQGGTPLAGPEQPRYVGPGRPLLRSSWRNRPWSAGLFVGGLFADAPMGNQVDADAGLHVGARLGYDLDHYLGWESRLGFATTGVKYRDAARRHSDMQVLSGEAVLLYYPWGDAQWRPYGLFGAGATTFDFPDLTGANVNQTSLTLPFGVGVKRRWTDDAAVRLEFYDQWAVGSGDVDAMHNLSLTMGVEFRFGGRRRSYWPWAPRVAP